MVQACQVPALVFGYFFGKFKGSVEIMCFLGGKIHAFEFVPVQ